MKKKLTFFRKTFVMNPLAISKLIYIGSISPIPENELIIRMKKILSIFHVINTNGMYNEKQLSR